MKTHLSKRNKKNAEFIIKDFNSFNTSVPIRNELSNYWLYTNKI